MENLKISLLTGPILILITGSANGWNTVDLAEKHITSKGGMFASGGFAGLFNVVVALADSSV